jgi:hypothetical protein
LNPFQILPCLLRLFQIDLIEPIIRFYYSLQLLKLEFKFSLGVYQKQLRPLLLPIL